MYLACGSLKVRSEAERFQLKRIATNVKTVVALIETPCMFEAWFMEATEATGWKIETIMDELIGGLAWLVQIRQERGTITALLERRLLLRLRSSTYFRIHHC